MNLLVTGGCGFIGSNFIERVINKKQIYKLVNVDCLSYAGSLDNTKKFKNHPKPDLEIQEAHKEHLKELGLWEDDSYDGSEYISKL